MLLSLHILDCGINVFEVRVEHGVLGGDALCRVALEHLVKKVEAKLVKSRHILLKWLRLVQGVIRLVKRKVFHLGPLLKRRSATALEDLHELVLFVLASKEGSASYELSKDASDRPNVH